VFVRFISRKEEEIAKDLACMGRYTVDMRNFMPIYQPSHTNQPRRESERDYLLRMARVRQAEERRANRRNVLRRITRRAR